MSAEIEQATGVAPVLTRGSGGVFDVFSNGELVFSKARSARFPAVGEIAELLE